MTTCVYKIEFTKSSLELNEDYDRLSEHEKEWIAQLDAESFFDYDSENGYICYVITSPMEIKKYLEILSNNFIQNKFEDLSKLIISHKIDLSEELRNYISMSNSIKWSFFIEDLEDWIGQNLDIDSVLDRISEVGMDSLTKVEKEFLKNYHI
jgi:hypothetical protein